MWVGPTLSLSPSGFKPLVKLPRTTPLSPGTIFLDPTTSNTVWNINLGRLIALWQTGSGNALAFADTPKTSGYCEFTINAIGTGTLGVGFSPSGGGLPGNTDYIHDNGIGYLSDGRVDFQNSVSFTGSTYGSGVVVGALVKNNKAYFHLNGVYQNSADPVAETGGVDVSTISPPIPTIFTNGSGAQVTVNFGGSAFTYAIPSGLTSWDGSQSNTLASITGTFSKTLGSLTSISASQLIIKATLAKTLGGLTLSSGSQLILKGTLNKTLGGLTGSSASNLLIKANLAKTLGVLTLSSQGSEQIHGSLTQSLGALTSASSGRLLIKGIASVQLGVLTLSASGQAVTTRTGLLNKTLGTLVLHSTTHSIPVRKVGYVSGLKSSVINQIKQARTHKPRLVHQSLRMN